jgi:hypothetical protein
MVRFLPFPGRAAFATILLLIAASAAHAQINVVRDLGCKLDDWEFDNGPLLNAAFERVGTTAQGGLNEEFYLPGGAIVFKTPLVLPKKTGFAMRGNGITLGMNEPAYTLANGLGGPASRLVYIGPSDQPAITYRGAGMKLDGVVLQRGKYPHPPAEAPRDGSVALRIEGNSGIPTGKLYAPQMAILGFDTAIHVTDKPTPRHADQNQFGYLWVQNCGTTFRCDNAQSVGNQFGLLSVGHFCDTIFDIRRGGNLTVTTLLLNTKALVFRLHDPSLNSNDFTILSMKVDSGAKGWRLVEMLKPAPLRMYVRGQMGRNATPAERPILLLGNPKSHNMTIDMWWNNRTWPTPGEPLP